MSWASRRRTTKVEDTAYCLLGIFDIQMPLLYGEREAAFERLQEAIINKYSDLTILAWKARVTHPDMHTAKNIMYHSWESGLVGSSPDSGRCECYHGIFACSPLEFEDSGSISSCFHRPSIFNHEFSITNKGLKMQSILCKSGSYGCYTMALMCCTTNNSTNNLEEPESVGEPLGILLKWVGGNTYVRANCIELTTLTSDHMEQSPGQDEFYLAPSVEQLYHSVEDLQRGSIRLPHPNDLFVPALNTSIVNLKVSPGCLWDAEERLFLTYGHQNPVGCATYGFAGYNNPLFMSFFGLHHNGKPWLCLVDPLSELFPCHVERRREYLRRTALEAKRSGTNEISIDITGHEERLYQITLNVEGSFERTGISERLQVYGLKLSLKVSHKLALPDLERTNSHLTQPPYTSVGQRSTNLSAGSELVRENRGPQSIETSTSTANILKLPSPTNNHRVVSAHPPTLESNASQPDYQHASSRIVSPSLKFRFLRFAFTLIEDNIAAVSIYTAWLCRIGKFESLRSADRSTGGLGDH